jgi:hypothetical protein
MGKRLQVLAGLWRDGIRAGMADLIRKVDDAAGTEGRISRGTGLGTSRRSARQD